MSRFSGQSLLENREGWLKELNKRIEALEDSGKDLADKEEKYGIELSKRLLTLTKIRSGVEKSAVAKGMEDIAHLRHERDIAKVIDRSALHSIYQAKIEIDIIESDIINERMAR